MRGKKSFAEINGSSLNIRITDSGKNDPIFVHLYGIRTRSQGLFLRRDADRAIGQSHKHFVFCIPYNRFIVCVILGKFHGSGFRTERG